jgi:hypothetical protein
MCGFTQINRHTFCLGFKLLKLFYIASPNLQAVSLVIYLIKRASLQFKHILNLLKTFSLNIRYLVKLINMFHTRGATNVCNKVYALLNISFNYPKKTSLQPNY